MIKHEITSSRKKTSDEFGMKFAYNLIGINNPQYSQPKTSRLSQNPGLINLKIDTLKFERRDCSSKINK